MAEFRVKNMNAQMVQVADVLYNYGPVVGTDLDEVRDLLAGIRRLVEREPLPQAAVSDALAVAERESAAVAPRAGRLAAAVSTVKELAAGLSSASLIAESVDRVMTALGGAT